MKSILFFLLFTTAAFAQDPNTPPYVPTCIEQDFIGIEDDGLDRAIVTYSNSKESCSSAVNMVFTSPNGISVRIEIIIGEEGNPKETILLYPEDPQMMSFPPQGEVLDGEIQKFIITGGIF